MKIFIICLVAAIMMYAPCAFGGEERYTMHLVVVDRDMGDYEIDSFIEKVTKDHRWSDAASVEITRNSDGRVVRNLCWNTDGLWVNCNAMLPMEEKESESIILMIPNKVN